MATNTVPKSTLRGAIVSTLGFSLESTVINSVDDYTFGGFGVEAFTPEDLFKSGDQGVWFDLDDDMDTKLQWCIDNPSYTNESFLAEFPNHVLFQTSTGDIPVTNVEQPLGLVLDKSNGLVLGPNTPITNWTAGSGTTVFVPNGNTIQMANTGYLSVGGGPSSPRIIGATYKISLSITEISGEVRVSLGNPLNSFSTAAFFNSVGNFTIYVVATDINSGINLEMGSGGSATVTINSINEIAGNHRTQATAANRPAWTARKNLYDRTEELDNVVWAKENVTITANAVLAPDGMMTADKMVETATNTSHNYFRTMSGLATTRYTVSEYAKAGERTEYALRGTLAGSPTINVNLVDGSVIFASTPGVENFAYTITNAGDGWWRISLSVDIPATTFTVVGFITINNGTSVYLGDANKGLYLWGRELTTSPTATRYQRVTTDTDYDAIGFPKSARYDGVNNSMATANIDYSTSDKVSIGVGLFMDPSLDLQWPSFYTFGIGAWSDVPNQFGYHNSQRRPQPSFSGNNAVTNYDPAFLESAMPYVLFASGDLAGVTLAEALPYGSINGTESPRLLRLAPPALEPGTLPQGGTFGTKPLNFGLISQGASRPWMGLEFNSTIINRLLTQDEISALTQFNATKSGVVLGRTPTGAEIDDTEQFIASKTGVTTTSRSDAEEQKRLP